MSTWLAKGPGDDDDDEIEVGGVTQTYRCPITFDTFKEACKRYVRTVLSLPLMLSTKCGHYYEYAAIVNHIASASRQRGNAKCPASGCNQQITKAMIVKDPAMQRRAEQFLVRQQQKKDDEEDLGDQSFIEI